MLAANVEEEREVERRAAASGNKQRFRVSIDAASNAETGNRKLTGEKDEDSHGYFQEAAWSCQRGDGNGNSSLDWNYSRRRKSSSSGENAGNCNLDNLIDAVAIDAALDFEGYWS